MLGFAALCFVVLTRHHWQQICDDAFIAFRYANHVAAGLGPVWNGGEPVEGYSSPLWLGILVVGRLAGAALPTFAGVVGVAGSATCIVLAQRFALTLTQSRVSAAAACAAASLLYPLYFWAPAGLETTWFTALVTFGAWSLIVPSAWRWPLAAALLGIARPEGPLLACVLIVLACLAHGRVAWRPVLLSLAPALAWLTFRRAFYGDWLPNTYYAKATGPLLFRVESGLKYALWALCLLAAVVVASWLAGIADRKIRCALAFLTVALGVVVVAGGDWMWHGRMLLPVLPSLVALATTGIARAPSRRRLVLALACVLAGSGFLPGASLLADAFAGRRLLPTAYQEGTMVPAALAAARFITAKYPSDALVAVNHAGALPFALPNPALDMTGLADRHIAREVDGGLHHKFDAAYVLARKPRVVVLNTRIRPGAGGLWYHAGYWPGETALVAQPEFSAAYRPVEVFWEWHWQAAADNFIVLFERI